MSSNSLIKRSNYVFQAQEESTCTSHFHSCQILPAGLQEPICVSFFKLWKSKCSLRTKFFCWLILVDRLNTKSMLKIRNLLANQDDLLCHVTQESKKTLITFSSNAPLLLRCWQIRCIHRKFEKQEIGWCLKVMLLDYPLWILGFKYQVIQLDLRQTIGLLSFHG